MGKNKKIKKKRKKKNNYKPYYQYHNCVKYQKHNAEISQQHHWNIGNHFKDLNSSQCLTDDASSLFNFF